MRYSKLSDDIEFLMQEESGSRKQNTKHIRYQYKYKYKYKYKYRNKYKYKYKKTSEKGLSMQKIIQMSIILA